MRLLIVDGGNVVMRCAYGGETAPAPAAQSAMSFISRAARFAQATHLAVAIDGQGETWRHRLSPAYKGTRTTDTQPWMDALAAACDAAQWMGLQLSGWEADDLVATLAVRQRGAVTVYSGDSDLLPLMNDRVEILRPAPSGGFEVWDAAAVEARYGVAPGRLVELKALTGESGDNIAGVPQIGPKRAVQLLTLYGRLDAIIAAGENQACRQSIKVAAAQAAARLAHQLITLHTAAPLPAIAPSLCRIQPKA